MNAPEPIVGELQSTQGVVQLPPPVSRVVDFAKRRRAIDLATLTDVRREMAKVYREVRFKKIPPEVGAKLTFMLISIAKVTEQAEMQPRIEAIERAVRQAE